jgi:hypothetical protein
MANITSKKVFISYSKDDKTDLEKLKKHLSPLIRNGSITLWDDRSAPKKVNTKMR